MFYHQQRRYHAHGFLLVLSLIAAFLLGRKSEEYGYTIISRGCECSDTEDDDEMDMRNNSSPNSNYPQ